MTRRVTILIAAVLGAALVLGSCSMFEKEYTAEPLPLPPEVDIAYGPVTGCASSPQADDICGGSQELDIYRSEEPGPNPVALWIHGGGFVTGDKASGVNEYFQPLLDDGWDIVAVNYRLAKDGLNRFPTAVQDVNRAVRWVKANADAQDWDADQVAAIGHSAGGNLAGMLATAADVPELQPTDLPTALQAVSPTIVAAVALNPVSDLALYAKGALAGSLTDYLGCSDCPQVMIAGSVQTYVDSDSAPYFAIHGADDVIASPEQGELVRTAYTAAGLEDRFELTVVDDGPEKFQKHEPDVRRFADDILGFINDGAESTSV